MFCTLCKSYTHVSCLNLYSTEDLDYIKNSPNNWTCPTCLNELFPYYTIDNTPDLLALTTQSYAPTLDLDQLILNPFDLNDEGEGLLPDLDANENFYNLQQPNTVDSQYLQIPDLNKQLPKSKNSFSVLHLNIRSLSKNFKNFRSSLALIEHKFSIIALTETWMKQHNTDLYNLEGYNHEFLVRNKKRGEGSPFTLKNLSTIKPDPTCAYLMI